MASLTNCLPVASYTAQEFPGDTFFGVNTMELQSPPTGAFFGDVVINQYYYLVIEAMPEFHVKASQINIGGVSVSGNTTGSAGLGFPGGIFVYNSLSSISAIADALPENVNVIRIYDSLGENFEDCNNKVIVEIKVNGQFEMPNNPYTISIDLGGTAVECEPDIPISDETGLAVVELYVYRNFVTNFSSESGYNIYFAHYYDSESYASSIYNQFNSNDYVNSSTSLGQVQLPVYDWNNNFYQTTFPDCYNDDCLNNFQPTCYTGYDGSSFVENGFLNDATTDAPNVISTTCGQLLINQESAVMQTSYGINTGVWDDHPNTNPCGAYNNKSIYKFWCQGANSSNTIPFYLSTVDYPNTEPGGPMLPSSLSWYITIGDNSNYNLETGTEFIDVWKIVTLKKPLQNGNLPSTNCDLDDLEGSNIASEYFVSDSTENNSDLDINEVELLYVDDKTVKMTIPFRTGLSISRFIQEDEYILTRSTKIFLNIYPTEI